MPFDWLHPKLSDALSRSFAERRLESQRREIRDRAGLLMRLGRSGDDAARRCRENVAWEFEMTSSPEVAAEVDALVEEVYRRG